MYKKKLIFTILNSRQEKHQFQLKKQDTNITGFVEQEWF